MDRSVPGRQVTLRREMAIVSKFAVWVTSLNNVVGICACRMNIWMRPG